MEILNFFENIPDIDEMEAEDLLHLKASVEAMIGQLDASEPKKMDSEEHETWEDTHEDLEDLLDDILDRLEEM